MQRCLAHNTNLQTAFMPPTVARESLSAAMQRFFVLLPSTVPSSWRVFAQSSQSLMHHFLLFLFFFFFARLYPACKWHRGSESSRIHPRDDLVPLLACQKINPAASVHRFNNRDASPGCKEKKGEKRRSRKEMSSFASPPCVCCRND